MGRGNREGKTQIFGDMFGTGPRNVDAVTSVVVRVGSEIPIINTVEGPGEVVSGCFIDNDAGAGGAKGVRL